MGYPMEVHIANILHYFENWWSLVNIAWPGFFKGGESITVSNRGQLPDCHVDLHTVCYLMWQKKKGLKGEEVISTQDTTSYNLHQ